LPWGSLGWLGGGYRLAAEARHDRALKVLDHVAQAPELIGDPLVLGDLILDLLEPLYDLLGDRAEFRTLWHLAPALELHGIVVERPPGTMSTSMINNTPRSWVIVQRAVGVSSNQLAPSSSLGDTLAPSEAGSRCAGHLA